MKPFLTILFLLILIASNYAQVIRVPQDYADIQTAIDSAKAGDTVLISARDYGLAVYTINKHLRIMGQYGDTVVVNCTLYIKDVDSVYIENLTLRPPWFNALEITNSRKIYLKNLNLYGGVYVYDWWYSFTNYGLLILNSDSIFISNSYVEGSQGYHYQTAGMYYQNRGWQAIHIISSTSIYIDSCNLKGGFGKRSGYHGSFTPGEHQKSIYATDTSSVIISNSHLLSPAFNDSTSTIAYNNVTGVKNKEENENIPASFSLKQNYPNPFNPSTIISYDLADESFITLKVYDILGREVAVLVNEIQKAGIHKAVFNGAALSSGVYIYRLQVNNKVFSRKMILQK